MASAPQDMPLETILRQAAQGDEAAWRQIVERYSARVYGLVRAQCGNNDLAEEITQSTFVTIVSKLAAYTESGKFEQWLFRIAMNRLRDEMRRRRRHAVSIEDEQLAALMGEAAEAPAADPHRTGGAIAFAGGAEESELRALRRAMADLSDADQRIIHLRHSAELSFKQIADLLGQPVGTVLARHHRALKKLRDLLGGREEEP